jgi:tetratricopeptide (TPR) repeat protein
MRNPTLSLLCLVVLCAPLVGAKTVFKEYDRVFTTYPYSDPDPVPTMSRFYPYFRYDGFTDKPIEKKWKVVELSNDYVQLLILPEIGGKVWAAIDKTTGKPFIYFNHVVKFRDVAMRGPWTSGGMEANYGIIGHTPNCFSPVDYLVRRNPDGGASCIIGTLDLLTRTTWRLEINLPADQACFSTRSFWHNASGTEQPYYTWMNIGIKSAGNLQFIHPGTHYIGHDGSAHDWPIDLQTGRDLSWYENNNFGSYKSYHVLGRLAEFFGGYWHDEDFGMAHCAPYGDKPGRKIWIWGLSREGMIWEDLLTDHDGQYVEVQSGRLFNQADSSSTLSPFKHAEFPPYATDTWTEHWLPVKGIKGFVSASPWGALNVTQQAGGLVIRISPTRALQDKLEVFDGSRLVATRKLILKPMQPVEETVALTAPIKALRVCVGGDKIQYAAGDSDVLSRPTAPPPGFDWDSVYGLYLEGKEQARQRAYVKAEQAFRACLEQDTNYLPALVEMASLANRRADPTNALSFSRRALSIDTYDPGANYQFASASAALGRSADAKEAFSIAALSPSWRGAAETELAKEYLREKVYDRAVAAAEESLFSNVRNLDALQVCACARRLMGDNAGANAALTILFKLDPLNHFAHCEQYLGGKKRSRSLTALVRNELPHETYLELAAWYHDVGLDEDAVKVLKLAPPKAEVVFWLAFLQRDTNLLDRALSASPEFVFPFRTEAIPVFEWAVQQVGGWQPKYYLALIRWHLGNLTEAERLLDACSSDPRFAPFYAARAQVVAELLTERSAQASSSGLRSRSPQRTGKGRGEGRRAQTAVFPADAAADPVLRDLQRAGQLDAGQWRFGVMLAQHCIQRGDPAAALAVAADYTKRFPANDKLALLRAKTLLLTGQNQLAADFLASLHVLPAEGTTEARALFREAHLLLAVDRLRLGSPDDALRLVGIARQWPERLGSGKPYASDIDERLEDWVTVQCDLALKDPVKARQALDKILTIPASQKGQGTGDLIRALALQRVGRNSEAEQLLKAWKSRDPESDLAEWGGELFDARPGPLPPSLQSLDCRVLAGIAQ